MLQIKYGDGSRRIVKPTADFYTSSETKNVYGKKVILTTEDKTNHMIQDFGGDLEEVMLTDNKKVIVDKKFKTSEKYIQGEKYLTCFSKFPVDKNELKKLKKELKREHKNDVLIKREN